MKILAIPFAHGLFKPLSGGQNRFYNLFKNLKGRKNTLILAEEVDFRDGREESCDKTYYYKDIHFFDKKTAIFRDFSLNYIQTMYKIVKTEEIDLIQITHPCGAFIIKLVSILNRKKLPIVYDAHNLESKFVNEILKDNPDYSKLEKKFVILYIQLVEKLTCKYIFSFITTVSPEEEDQFTEKYGLNKEKIAVIPSGCNVKPETDENHRDSVKKSLNIDLNTVIIIFHGLYSHRPNKEAFDLIKDYISPQFKGKNVLFLVGGTGSPEIRYDNFYSIGFIKNLDAFLSIADMAIVPLRKGAGTKLKMLDYLSHGIPIVTTRKGAEGLRLTNDDQAMITEDVDEKFVDVIMKLSEDEKKRKTIGYNAKKLAESVYSWDKIGNKLNNSYCSLLNRK